MASNSRLLALFSLAVASSLVTSRLVIYGPQELKDKFAASGNILIIEFNIYLRLQNFCKLC